MIEEIKSNPDLSSIEVVGVINLNPLVAIQKANYDSYADLVMKYNIPAYYCEDVNEKDCFEFVQSKNPDIIIQSGWSQKFSDDLLNIPKIACIGEHPAPLPRGRGAACVNWAIIKGEKEWGDTFFKMESTYDTGSVYAQKNFKIEEYDTVKTVYDKVKLSSKLIIRENIVNWCNGSFNIVEQDESKATYFKRRRPADGQFRFTDSAKEIYDLVRAVAEPYPGAFFEARVNGVVEKVIVWEANHMKSNLGSNVIDQSTCNGSVRIGCKGETAIELIRVQVEGQPEMWAKDFFNNNNIEL